MPRPLRFEYAGAMYHVMNRGNYRSWIFEDSGAKLAFEKCLFEACGRAGWILHAYCVMGNHYHLALETPQANLSEGMRWLQGVFATRFNRFRKESGHLFQGRFKSIVVEDWQRLAWLCHYIHLNPVRAGIAATGGLRDYRFGSYHWLWQGKARPDCLSFEACLEGAGGLKDTAAGRRKYGEYLALLLEDEPRARDMLFDRMSKGWALGTKEFKKALLRDSKMERAVAELGGSSSAEAGEAAELIWEGALERCLDVAGKSESDAMADPKSAEWKVGIAAWMKRRFLCRNRWLSDRLSMGTDSGVSRCVKQLNDGERPEAARLLKQLAAKIKY